jgi:hypothetical protein
MNKVSEVSGDSGQCTALAAPKNQRQEIGFSR